MPVAMVTGIVVSAQDYGSVRSSRAGNPALANAHCDAISIIRGFRVIGGLIRAD